MIILELKTPVDAVLKEGLFAILTLYGHYKASLAPALSNYAPCCCNMGRMWLAIVRLKWTFLKRCCLEGNTCCSKICIYFIALTVPSQKCTQLTYQTMAFDIYTFLLWSREHGIHYFHKQPERLTFQIAIHVSNFSGLCWRMASPVWSRVLIWICGCSSKRSKYSKAHFSQEQI